MRTTRSQPIIQPSRKIKKSPKIRKSRTYATIPQIPIIQLDLTREPFEYFQSLQDKYHKYGAVLLQVDWDMPTCFENVERPVSTKIQNIHLLSQGESFGFKVGGHTVKSFRRMADKFESVQSTTSVEEEYWDIVGGSRPVTVEYAADLPSNKYGSAFPQHSYQCKGTDYSKDKYNLYNINEQLDSPFQVMQSKRDQISGVTKPWVYLGMKYASFCWHTENMYFSALNYHHKGADKTWYFIPESGKELFDNYVEQKGFNKSIINKIVLQIDPLELIHNKIPVYRCIQKQKCIVITFPKVYHCGFSHGFNITEAINICLPSNLHYIDISLKEETKTPIMPKEYLVIACLELRNKIKLSKNTKCIIRRLGQIIIIKELQLRSMVRVNKYDNSLRYYDVKCSNCNAYSYLSWLQCQDCTYKSCCQCQQKCPIMKHNTIVIFRQTNNELQKLVDQF